MLENAEERRTLRFILDFLQKKNYTSILLEKIIHRINLQEHISVLLKGQWSIKADTKRLFGYFQVIRTCSYKNQQRLRVDVLEFYCKRKRRSQMILK